MLCFSTLRVTESAGGQFKHIARGDPQSVCSANKSAMPVLLVWDAHLYNTALAPLWEGFPSLAWDHRDVLLAWGMVLWLGHGQVS